MRKPEADMPTEYDRRLRVGRWHGRGSSKKVMADKREYYHRLRGKLEEDLRRERNKTEFTSL